VEGNHAGTADGVERLFGPSAGGPDNKLSGPPVTLSWYIRASAVTLPAMFKGIHQLLSWFLHLFNPPPREEMLWWQKVARILLVTSSLVVVCILAAMLGTITVFLVQSGVHMLESRPQFLRGLMIVLVAVCVNVVCVRILLEIRRIDRKLLSRGDS